jgi:hypothetical protein
LTADHCGIILEVTPRHAKEEDDPTTGGSKFECKYNEETEETTLYVAKVEVATRVFVETDLIDFVEEPKMSVARYTEDPVVVRTINVMAKYSVHMQDIGSVCGGLWKTGETRSAVASEALGLR